MLASGEVSIGTTATKIAQAPIGLPATVYVSFLQGTSYWLGDSTVGVGDGLHVQNMGGVMSISLGRGDTLYGIATDQQVKIGWMLSA